MNKLQVCASYKFNQNKTQNSKIMFTPINLFTEKLLTPLVDSKNDRSFFYKPRFCLTYYLLELNFLVKSSTLYLHDERLYKKYHR